MSVTKPVTITNEATSLRLPAELVESTSFLLKRLGFKAKSRALDAYEALGITPYHYAILVALDDGAPPTQGAIADTLGYDKGQLVGLLDELEEQGLSMRRRDPSDRRRQIVTITPEGKRMLGKLRTLNRKLDDELLAPLDDAERRKLHALLLKLAQKQLPGCGA
jgi:MarR family transcriptional regulator, lower aerobic nicotinate degradation pathway regulator